MFVRDSDVFLRYSINNMKNKKILSIKFVLSSFVLILGLILTPVLVNGAEVKQQDIKGNLKLFGDQSYGTTAVTNPVIVAAKIINAGLGILGILMVIYFVYGGVMWMTAGGESNKIDTAKGSIRSAIIGLIIIVSAFAIANFVTDALTKSTGQSGGATPTSSGGGGG